MMQLDTFKRRVLNGHRWTGCRAVNSLANSPEALLESDSLGHVAPAIGRSGQLTCRSINDVLPYDATPRRAKRRRQQQPIGLFSELMTLTV